MSDRDFTVYAPELPSDLHKDVVAEIAAAWDRGRPWTFIRETRKGVDAIAGASCVGCHGCFHIECKKPVEGVQYNVQGVAQFYCEAHALEQHKWDASVYEGKGTPIRPERTEEDDKWLKKFLEKGKKKPKEEPEESDLMK